MIRDVKRIEVVLANNDRVTLRVDDVFLKIDVDQTRTNIEVAAMALAPVPTPEVLWRNPPALALSALQGAAIGDLGTLSSPEAWVSAGVALRALHEAPLPPWPGESLADLGTRLDDECEWLIANDVLPTEVITGNRKLAEKVLRPWTPVFTHGDLHAQHVFVEDGKVTGFIDWSEASQGDALFDIAILTLAHEEHLDDVLAGYGAEIDRDMIHSWRSFRCLTAIRWLMENGYGPPEDYPEVAVLLAAGR